MHELEGDLQGLFETATIEGCARGRGYTNWGE
jgi:hypothetical protein